MPRATTLSFIAEFPLRTTASDERELGIRLDAARNIFNAALGQALRVLDLMRQSKQWQLARSLAKGEQRTVAFKACIDRFDFKSSMTDRFAIACKNACWIGSHLTSNETQKVALRAFQAVQQYGFGKRGRPRFKRFETLNSVEGKTNRAGIRFRDCTLEWDGLRISILAAENDDWQRYALECHTKYCRIIRRTIRGRARWFLQLIQEGRPFAKYSVGDAVVGLDIGPSTIAAVSTADAMLEPFCPTVVQPWKKLRVIERGMDRSRQATNPANYQPDGTIKKGTKSWTKSERYKARQHKRAEVERRLAVERKRAHGELANRILAQGSAIKTENVSYRSFQKNFGRSTKVRAAGMFVAMLSQKAEAAGGEVVEFNTRTTKLSQFDHISGEYIKKPLSQRQHTFADGTIIHRDLYSAFLAAFVEKDNLDARSATVAFPAAKPLLERAASSEVPTCERGCGFPLPRVLKDLRAGRPLKKNSGPVEAKNVVPGSGSGESLGEIGHIASSEPPGFSRGEV